MSADGYLAWAQSKEGFRAVTEDELMPCPFCGSTADFTTRPNQKTRWGVMCDGCTAYRVGETREEAIAAWNTRASNPIITATPPESAERALMIELATQMALAAGFAPHCWPTWEQEATVIIPTIAALTTEREREIEAALRIMIYETTHLSPCEGDGSHWCKISGNALSTARRALSGATVK